MSKYLFYQPKINNSINGEKKKRGKKNQGFILGYSNFFRRPYLCPSTKLKSWIYYKIPPVSLNSLAIDTCILLILQSK